MIKMIIQMIGYLRVIWWTPWTTSTESRFLSRSMTSHGKPNSKNIYSIINLAKYFPDKIYETKMGKYAIWYQIILIGYTVIPQPFLNKGFGDQFGNFFVNSNKIPKQPQLLLRVTLQAEPQILHLKNDRRIQFYYCY